MRVFWRHETHVSANQCPIHHHQQTDDIQCGYYIMLIFAHNLHFLCVPVRAKWGKKWNIECSEKAAEEIAFDKIREGDCVECLKNWIAVESVSFDKGCDRKSSLLL